MKIFHPRFAAIASAWILLFVGFFFGQRWDEKRGDKIDQLTEENERYRRDAEAWHSEKNFLRDDYIKARQEWFYCLDKLGTTELKGKK